MTAIIESLYNTIEKFKQNKSSQQERQCKAINLMPMTMNMASFNCYRNQPHRLDLFCFQSCSTWILNLTSITNESNLSSSCFYGALNQPLDSMLALTQAIPQEIIGYLPIDLCKNQRFVFNPSQAKVNLNIVFDLIGNLDHFTNVNNQYGMVLFDINLYGKLHGIKLFRDLIDFKVKGFDIQKSIASVLSDKDITHIISRNQFVTVFNAVVFSNIQCSFVIEFCITNYNLTQYYAMLSKTRGDSAKIISLCNFGIIINKLKIVYNLPLCVFSHDNYKGVIYFEKQLFYQSKLNQYKQEQIREQNLYMPNCKFSPSFCPSPIEEPVLPQKSSANFCNWHSFMTFTTPMIFETEQVTVRNILDSFIKPSLFGIRCLFKARSNKYTQVNYFPSLSSIAINDNKRAMKALTSSNSNLMTIFQNFQNESSTVDESLLTYSNSLNEDFNSPWNKTIFYIETAQELFNTKTYNEQLKLFYRNYPHCSELSLEDISPSSWFSITWSPTKTFQSKGFYEDTETNWNQSSSFKVFYQFRGSSISNTAHFLPVIGLLEKNIHGKTINTSTPQSIHFWFANLSVDSTDVSHGTKNNDNILNNKSYISFIEKGCKLE